MFSSRKKKERQKEEVKKFLFFMGVSEQPLGGALVGGCVLPVLSFIPMNKSWSWGAFGEEHSVKTAAHVDKRLRHQLFEELERE